MAKLCANGRTELARVRLEVTPANDPEVALRVTERAFMSDRACLEKHAVVYTDGTRHDFGWTKRGTIKAEFTPGGWQRHYAARGWDLA